MASHLKTRVPFERPICEVCMMHFISDEPLHQSRVLPCGHTFCFACLQQLHANSNASEMQCPHCRVVIAMDTAALLALPRNYMAEGHGPEVACPLENANALIKGVPTCESCTSAARKKWQNTRRAILFCTNCSSALCQACDENIHFDDVMKKHKRVDLAKRPLPCPDHHEAMLLFCEQDKVLVCNDCLKPGAKHGGHCAVHVDEAVAMEQEKMKLLVAVLKREKQRIADELTALTIERHTMNNSANSILKTIEQVEFRAAVFNQVQLEKQYRNLRLGGRVNMASFDSIVHSMMQLARALESLQTDTKAMRLQVDAPLLHAHGLLVEMQKEIDRALGLAMHAQRRLSNLELVQQHNAMGVGRQLEEVAMRAQAAGWKRGRKLIKFAAMRKVVISEQLPDFEGGIMEIGRQIAAFKGRYTQEQEQGWCVLQ